LPAPLRYPYERSRRFDSNQANLMIHPPLEPQIETLLTQVDRLVTLPAPHRRERGAQILLGVASINAELRTIEARADALPTPGMPSPGAVFFTSQEGRRRFAEQLQIRSLALTARLPDHAYAASSFQLSELTRLLGGMDGVMHRMSALQMLVEDLSMAHARLRAEPGQESDLLELFRRLTVVTWWEAARSPGLEAETGAGPETAVRPEAGVDRK